MRRKEFTWRGFFQLAVKTNKPPRKCLFLFDKFCNYILLDLKRMDRSKLANLIPKMLERFPQMVPNRQFQEYEGFLLAGVKNLIYFSA